MPNDIKKIERTTAGELIYLNLRDNIIAHKWLPGEKLPSETELASMYGVNRLTVRTALQRLNAIGLVETRVGDGTYVRQFNFPELIHEIQDLYSSPGLMNEVCGFRMLIEVECARLAMENAVEADFEKLNMLCEEYERLKIEMKTPVSQEQLQQLTECDVNFHEQICVMSHNTLLTYCFLMARKTIERYIFLTLQKRISGWTKSGISLYEGDYRHRAIMEAIQEKDFPKCKKLYEDMIDFHVEL